MSDLRDLYQDVILDHSKHPRNEGKPETPGHEAKGNNPLCGDKVTVYVTVDDGIVQDIRFVARGCAISVASASMMSELAKGKSAEEFQAMFNDFHEAVTAKDPVAPEKIEKLDKLAALIGVREFPMRVKCATLPWHTMAAAIDESAQEVTTE